MIGGIYLLEGFVLVMVGKYGSRTMNEFFCIIEEASSAFGGVAIPAGIVPGMGECTLINSFCLNRHASNGKGIQIGKVEKKYWPFFTYNQELWWNGREDHLQWPYLDLYLKLDEFETKVWKKGTGR